MLLCNVTEAGWKAHYFKIICALHEAVIGVYLKLSQKIFCYIPRSTVLLFMSWVTRFTDKNWTRSHYKSLSYKPGGRGFDSRWCHWDFHWRNPSGHTMINSTSNRNGHQEYFLRGTGGRCYGCHFFTFLCVCCLETLGTSTFWNTRDLSRPV